MHITLVDSLGKRVKFLEAVVDKLGFENAVCLHGRAEELGQAPEHREKYDAALARAVAGLPVLCEYLLPLVRVGGTAAAMKGPGGRGEVEEASKALQTLGGEVVDIWSHLPSSDQRRNHSDGEGSSTPREYPRRPGIPQKRPLV